MPHAPLFQATEILDMAIRIERNGADFYEACAEAASNPAAREVFKYLVEQEHRHLELFQGMKQGLETQSLPESYPGELLAYIESLVSDRVFEEAQRGREQAQRIGDHEEAIRFAIEFEEKSILFYSAVKQVARESEKHVIEEVIGEEHKHILRLIELRDRLKQ